MAATSATVLGARWDGQAALNLRHSPADSLQLQEIAAFEMPPGYEVRSVRFVGADTVVIWPTLGVVVKVCAVDTCTDVPLDTLRSVLDIRYMGESVEFIDGRSGVLVTSRGSHESSSVTQAPFGEPMAATRSGGAWVIAAAHQQHDGHLEAAPAQPPSPSGLLVWLDQRNVLTAQAALPTAAGVHLSTIGDHVIVQEIPAPFRAWRAERVGGGVEFTPLAPIVVPARPGTTAREATYAALARVPIQGGAILTIADLASDERHLLVLDDDGFLLRARTLNVPIGFVAGEPSFRRLAAVRNTGVDEVVIYQYTMTGSAGAHAGTTNIKEVP